MRGGLAYIRRNLSYALPWKWKAGIKAIYRRLSGSGIFISGDELGMCSLHPVKKIDRIVELVQPRRVLDVGCGTGRSTVYLHGRGIDVRGIEASRVAIRNCERPDLVVQHDLRLPLDIGASFDLVWCFEVAEHIHPRHVETFVDTLVRHSGVVALSAAPPGQGGEGHFNEQPQSYWEEKFSKRGFVLHEAWTAKIRDVDEFYSENMMVFVRRGAT